MNLDPFLLDLLWKLGICIFGILAFYFLIQAYFIKRRRDRMIECAHVKWWHTRQLLRVWMATNPEKGFELHEAQQLVQAELGALAVYTRLKSSLTLEEKERIEWLAQRMSDDVVANLPDRFS